VGTARREFDITVLGATGFTGGLIAAYLAEHAPDTTRIALAGRNNAKLETLRSRIGAEFDLVTVDSSQPAAMLLVAERTRVLISTVGPYVIHGGAVVAACADAGTDYLDLTGEPEFVDLTYLKHHARAVHTGARLVHACGFDSIPHDLGAQFTVEHLPEGVPLAVSGYVHAHGTFSGGTAASALEIMARHRAGRAAHRVRGEVEPLPGDRRARVVPGRIGLDKESGSWVVPLPTIDPLVVTQSARQLPRYGPDFAYSHFWAGDNPIAAVGVLAGMGTLFTAAQIPAVRHAIERHFPSGSGPSPERRERSWFRVQFVGTGGGSKVVTEVSGGDPGYSETSKMISDAALCLANDDLTPTSGQVTPASAMGPALRSRLQVAGINFELLSST
jgi:short subunit dehydrogenase-like uncharacterized protein